MHSLQNKFTTSDSILDFRGLKLIYKYDFSGDYDKVAIIGNGDVIIVPIHINVFCPEVHCLLLHTVLTTQDILEWNDYRRLPIITRHVISPQKAYLSAHFKH